MAIEQHPIPQDVAGYRFRLIGEMTLIQFLWLAGGILVAFIFWSSPLPFFFKYPIAIIFASLGAGIAFVPIQGRPMDKWIIAFIKSIYSPTQYVWREVRPDSLVSKQPQPGTNLNPLSKTPAQPITPQTQTSTQYIAQPVNTPALSRPLTPAQPPKDIPPVIASPQVVPQPAANAQPTPVIQPVIATPTPTRSETIDSLSTQAKTEVRLPIPFTPTTPNTLVGMTLTPEGKILDGALIEIRQQGLSVRATRSNSLGQFLFAKPLDNGNYQIITDKTGYLFESYTLELKNQIVKPLKIQAKSSAT